MSEEKKTIREMAEGGAGEEAEPELIPRGTVEGDGLGLLDIFRLGAKNVSSTCVVRGGEFDVPGGLLDPNREGILLMTYRYVKPEPVPVWRPDTPRGEARVLSGYKLRQVIEPIHVERAKQGDAGALKASFIDLLSNAPQTAGALLDELNQMAGKKLATA
jgi:hypothetical protein